MDTGTQAPSRQQEEAGRPHPGQEPACLPALHPDPMGGSRDIFCRGSKTPSYPLMFLYGGLQIKPTEVRFMREKTDFYLWT